MQVHTCTLYSKCRYQIVLLTRGLTKSLVSDQLIVSLRTETTKGIQQACYNHCQQKISITHE